MSEFRKRQMMAAASGKEDRYLTFTAVQDNSVLSIDKIGNTPTIKIEYSTDNGSNWNTYTWDGTSGLQITLAHIGDKVKFRGTNTATCDSNSSNRFVGTGIFDCSGDVTSLFNGIGGDYTFTRSYSCAGLFRQSPIRTAPNLPSTIITQRVYYNMFRECSLLETGPVIAATNTTLQCCRYMFYNSPKVNFVEIHFTELNAQLAIDFWLFGTASSGIVKCPQTLSIPSDSSGVPRGWTRYNLDGTPYVEP